MTVRRAKLNLGPGGQQKPPPNHAFADGIATDVPPAADSQDHSDRSQADASPNPGAADSHPGQAERGFTSSTALAPAAIRLLRHPAVRVGLVSAAAALSIWLLRRRLF